MTAFSCPSLAVPFGASSAGVGVPSEVAVEGPTRVGGASPLARFFFADFDSVFAGWLVTAADMVLTVRRAVDGDVL